MTRVGGTLALLFAASLAAVAANVAIGSSDIALGRLVGAFAGEGAPGSEWVRRVIADVRLPRAIVAWLVGAALGASGCALQGLFRNPLADPAVLGVSASAGLAAQLVIFAGLAVTVPWAVPVAAMAGAAAATLALVLAIEATHHDALETLVLAGVALGHVAIAGSSLLVSIALADFSIAQQLLHWLLGSLDGRTWLHASWAVGPVIVGVAALVLRARELDALLLGDVTAASLGVDVLRLRRTIVVAVALLTGASVAVGGVVGFVGLVVPHALRRTIGVSHGPLLAGSVLGGGALVVVADLVARRAIAPIELQIGVVTAAVGAPWFLVLLRRRFVEVAA